MGSIVAKQEALNDLVHRDRKRGGDGGWRWGSLGPLLHGHTAHMLC